MMEQNGCVIVKQISAEVCLCLFVKTAHGNFTVSNRTAVHLQE